MDKSLPLSLVFHRIPPRNTHQPLVCYHTLKICCILEGRCLWHIEKKTYTVVKGDIILLNNSERRGIHLVYPPEDLVMMYLDFEPRLIWPSREDALEWRYMKIFLNRDDSFENRISSESSAAREIEGLMWRIGTEMRERKPEYDLMAKSLLLQALALLCRHYSGELSNACSSSMEKTDAASESVSTRNRLAMNQVLNYIEGHLSQPLTLEGVARLIPMNPSYFSRLFKKYNGLGLSRYIAKRRIQKAVELINKGEQTVLDIAGLCGYESLSGFYRAFKEVTGRSPSEYRKEKLPVLLPYAENER